MTDQAQNAGWRSRLAGIALAIAVFTVAWFIIAALGTRTGLWSWQFGLGTMIGSVVSGWARFLVGLSLILSIAAVIVSLIAAPRVRPFMLAIAALLISLYAGGRWMGFQLTARALPPIHDVQTDWADPIAFTPELMAAREAAGEGDALNPVLPDPVVSQRAEGGWPGTAGKRVAALQESAEFDPETMEDRMEAPYPQLETLRLDASREKVIETAREIIGLRSWELVTDARQDTGAWRLEATVTSTWFGFKDDVAIRIRDSGPNTSLVDMRSVSRVGLSDLGANAARIDLFLTDLKRALASGE